MLIVSDQHRADAAGCYGSTVVKTPALDRLAADGIRFDRAYCQSPLCAPSRGSMMTGTHCHTCAAYTQKTEVDRSRPTIGTVFRDGGYATGAFGKMHVVGEDERHDLGFSQRGLRIFTKTVEHYGDVVPVERMLKYWAEGAGEWDLKNYNPWNRPIEMADEDIFDQLVVNRSIEFLESCGTDPFCLFVGIEKPHPDWYAPKTFHDMYDPAAMPLPTNYNRALEGVPASMSRRQDYLESHRHTEQEIRGCVAAYYANVSYVDFQVGRLLDTLDRLDLSRNTVVVYTSDHGETLFENGWVQKHCFLESAVRVPLVIRGPDVPAGAASGEIVSLVDLFPTFAEMAALPVPDGLEGESLIPLLRGDDGASAVEDEPRADGQRAAFSEYYWTSPPSRMVRTNRWKYIHTQEEIPQLYDMRNDRGETRNLADDPAFESICDELRKRVMDGWEIPTLDIDLTAIESRYAGKAKWLRERQDGADGEPGREDGLIEEGTSHPLPGTR